MSEDPCVLTGFEVGEALRALQGRASLLKMKGWGCFGRRVGEKVVVKVRAWVTRISQRWGLSVEYGRFDVILDTEAEFRGERE